MKKKQPAPEPEFQLTSDPAPAPKKAAKKGGRQTSLEKLIEAYYARMAEFAHQNVLYEMGTRAGFFELLAAEGRKHGWTLIAEHEKKVNGQSIRPDGTFKDAMNLVRGYWEAKDTSDKLDSEIQKKVHKGYPLSNTLFEDTATAVLYQDGREILRVEMKDPAKLAELVSQFFRHIEPEIEEFEHAVDQFKERVPDLAEGLAKKIEQAHRTNSPFKRAFADFFELCRSSLNPNLSQAAVDEMLIQHILTERLIREIFDNPEFVRRNVIAAEVEKVMQAMTSQSFDRNTYLRDLDRFYVAIENAARTMTDFSDKQHFLNTVYERFFQGYSVKLADTMGIVYTPQEIVDFMCASVAEVLEKEFGKKLWSDDVYLIDPCTGTGNFIVNLIRRIPKAKLESVYKHRLFANEIMLLPYYIAALNIEHAYFEQTGHYEPFEGLCFVDTLDLAQHAQGELGFMTAKNSERVERQRKSPITVVIGNPPYNASQVDETDNNKNRQYEVVDTRIRDTYIAANSARKTKLYDPYVRFFRWATDRLQDRDGIVCFISNNSFVHQIACDGLQKCLAGEFSTIYHMDLRGNVRENPTLSGTAYNVFGIQVGVGITIAVRHGQNRPAAVHFHALPLGLRRREKLVRVASAQSVSGVGWKTHTPDAERTWMRPSTTDAFSEFIRVASREAKNAEAPGGQEVIFRTFSLGVSTNRDSIVYGVDAKALMQAVGRFVDVYASEQERYARTGAGQPLDDVLDHDSTKWSRNLKRSLLNGDTIEVDSRHVRDTLYRPFTTKKLYFADVAVDEPGQFPKFLPSVDAEQENRILIMSDRGYRAGTFSVLASSRISDLHLCASTDGHQCFPFYVYDADGKRRENITDWALNEFRTHYKDPSITKWDIFYYVYGLLHHPGYRLKFADNLKRELPRIPFAPPLPADGRRGEACLALDPTGGGRGSPDARRGEACLALGPTGGNVDLDVSGKGGKGGACPAPTDARIPARSGKGTLGGETPPLQSSGFRAFAEAGKKLAELHLDYEQLKPYELEQIETPGVPLSWKVEDKMRLNKEKTKLTVNPSLALAGIPPKVYEYRLGNRSALEWVIDQYQVYTDKRSGIVSDPNREEDPQYIVRLVGQVVRVSVETVDIVAGLPKEFAEAATEEA